MSRILVLTHRLPFPPDRGDRIRSYRIIKHMAERHHVALAAVSQGPPDPAHVGALEKLCASVDVGVVRPLAQGIAALGRLPTAEPLTLSLFWSRRLKARIEARLRRDRFDVVFVYCSSMAPYAPDHPELPMVIDLVDADSEKWRERARYAPWPLGLVYRREAWLLRRFERRIALAAAHVLVASEREAAIVRALAPAAPVTAVPNGVEISAGAPPVEGGPPRLLFTGVMDYWPNVDAARRLVWEILPRVRERVSDAEAVIVGQRPSAAVRRLGRVPGVTVTGAVPDVAPYLRSGSVFVAPLRLARGIQNKILEAMAARLPVVCSEAAAGGLTAVPGRHLIVADDPESMAKEVIALLRSPSRRAAVAAAALAFVTAHHRWEDQLARIEAIVDDVKSAGAVSP